MAAKQTSKVFQSLRRAALLQDGAGLTDRQLLQEYLSRREEAALAALVRRHGPMVWGVCRRVLRNYHDVEDAFQATFLVFVRKAASIAFPELLANWLYGVAHQTALKARATSAKRQTRERQVKEMPEQAVTENALWDELQPVLDQELSGLPEKYRVAVVLCLLEGKTRKEAAKQVGVPEGTLAARLARGRKMLALRLARHGLTLSAGSLAAVLAENTASSAVPASVMSSTLKAASLFTARQAAAAGVISLKAALLTEGVLKTMFLTKAKIVTAVVLGVGLLGIGWGLYPKAAAPPEAMQEATSSPPAEFHAPDKNRAEHAKDGPGEKKIGLPKGPPPVQVVVSRTKDGKLMVKSEHVLMGMRAIAKVHPGAGPNAMFAGPHVRIRDFQEDIGRPHEAMKFTYDLKDVQVLDTQGNEVGKEELAKLLTDEMVAVASFGPVDPLHLRILKEGTLIFILPPPSPDELPMPGGMPAIPPKFGPATVQVFYLRTQRPVLESPEP
jgi:RNA polymerase sigma factor (sigma-70 family)